MSPIPDQPFHGSVGVAPRVPHLPSSGTPTSSCESEGSVSSVATEGTQTDGVDSGLGMFRSEEWSEDEVDHVGVIQRLSDKVGSLFMQDRIDRATQTAKDPLTSETEKLSFDIVFYVLGRRPSSSSSATDDVTRCLRTSVQRMLDKHEPLFNGMVARLHLGRSTDLHKGFMDMSNELFKQNEVSWSKIVALFAFAARLAQYCNDHDLGNLVFDVATNLSQFAVEKLTPFLKEHGGWSTLCDAFPLESDYEGTIWRSLVITGVGLTLMATLLAMQH